MAGPIAPPKPFSPGQAPGAETTTLPGMASPSATALPGFTSTPNTNETYSFNPYGNDAFGSLLQLTPSETTNPTGTYQYYLTPAQQNLRVNTNDYGSAAANEANSQMQTLEQEQIPQAEGALLAHLNSMGLLQSYLSGGLGNYEKGQLEQNIGNAAEGINNNYQNFSNAVQQEAQQGDQALTSLNNAWSNFQNYQQQQQPGLLDFLALGAEALPLLI